MRQFQSELEQRSVDVKIVTFDDDFMGKAYVTQTRLSWPLLVDTDRSLYRAYGMGNASLWKLVRPSAIFRYLGNIFRGNLPGKKGSDIHQLGGDVLINPQNQVCLHHISQHPHDRPSVSVIMDIIRRG